MVRYTLAGNTENKGDRTETSSMMSDAGNESKGKEDKQEQDNGE